MLCMHEHQMVAREVIEAYRAFDPGEISLPNVWEKTRDYADDIATAKLVDEQVDRIPSSVDEEATPDDVILFFGHAVRRHVAVACALELEARDLMAEVFCQDECWDGTHPYVQRRLTGLPEMLDTLSRYRPETGGFYSALPY